jgi:hypothetical protein
MTYQGETYEGDWFKNKRTGRGKMTFLDNEVYEGDFDENVMSGQGAMYFANGDVYRGSFSDGVRHGGGVLVLASGESWPEQWRHGEKVREGEGVCGGVDAVLWSVLLAGAERVAAVWGAATEAVVTAMKQYNNH